MPRSNYRRRLNSAQEKKEYFRNNCNKRIWGKQFNASIGSEILEHFKDSFPEDYSTVFALAILRVIEKCPFKCVDFLYERSYLSEIFGKLALLPAKLTSFLHSFGMKREQHVGFMKEYLSDSCYILFDGTNIINSYYVIDES